MCVFYDCVRMVLLLISVSDDLLRYWVSFVFVSCLGKVCLQDGCLQTTASSLTSAAAAAVTISHFLSIPWCFVCHVITISVCFYLFCSAFQKVRKKFRDFSLGQKTRQLCKNSSPKLVLKCPRFLDVNSSSNLGIWFLFGYTWKSLWFSRFWTLRN